MGYLRMDHAHHRVSWHSILGLFNRRRAFLPNRLGSRNRYLVRVVLMKPHKYADLIHAWAEGAEIESRTLCTATLAWDDWRLNKTPNWVVHDLVEFRIKTETKDDVVLFKYIKFRRGNVLAYEDRKPNMKYVFDGETGWLKSAEVLK